MGSEFSQISLNSLAVQLQYSLFLSLKGATNTVLKPQQVASLKPLGECTQDFQEALEKLFVVPMRL